MAVTLTRPMLAALAKAEAKHNEVMQDYLRAERAGVDPDALAGYKAFLEESWRRITGMRAEYGDRSAG